MKTFYSIFPYTKNELLSKPNGLIPYTFHKEYGYDSTIVTYNIDNYKDDDIKGVKFDFIKKITKNQLIDVSIYIIKNAKKIDILHSFFWGKEKYIWITLYKWLNKKGKVYISMDADERIKNNSMKSSGIKAKIKKHFLDKCDLISTETNDVYLWLKENFYDNIKHIPFGVLPSENITKYDKKENTIITVGRIGTYQKATDILLEAYKRAYSSIHSWKLKIIGPIEKDFESEIDKFFTENPELKAKIEFAGPIFDREKLMKEYEKAKIFCLPSRYEGCPCVLTEAETRGCYIIASNMAATKDVTQNQKYGSLFEIDNVEELAEILKKICKNESKLKENCENVQKFVNENYAWRSVCKKALKYLEED